MITINIQGAKLQSVSQIIEIPSKRGGNPFQKREVVLDETWIDREGNTHPVFVSIDFFGDAMATLDQYMPGQPVNITAQLTGRESNGRVYNSVRGKSIAPYIPQGAMPQSQQQQQYQQQPQQQHAYTPAPTYPQQQAYPQQGFTAPPAYATPPQPAQIPQPNNGVPF